MNAQQENLFQEKRRDMVDEQLIPRGISSNSVLDAFYKVPRHKFVDEEYINEAYGDFPLPVGDGQTISQPYMVAAMTQCLKPKKADKVLEIGTGSGYQAAILAELVDKVYTIERFRSLSQKAQRHLQELNYHNVEFKVGDGSQGWKECSPYDGIIVTCAAPNVPEPLKEQLAEGGRLVIPIGGRFGQTLTIIRREKSRFIEEQMFGCVFVPLVGKYGWRGE